MAKSELEPTLTFKLSENDFRCSACQVTIASVGNGRFVVAGLTDLIAAFRDHVAHYHAKADS